jgi:hypothetical protein
VVGIRIVVRERELWKIFGAGYSRAALVILRFAGAYGLDASADIVARIV